jgi:hypothetical protein
MSASQTDPEHFALEFMRCAYVSLNNMVKMMPVLSRHPLLPIMRGQLRSAIEALDPEGGAMFCNREDRQ